MTCQHLGITRMHTSGCGSTESFVGHDGVGSRQRQEAPVGPVPSCLSALHGTRQRVSRRRDRAGRTNEGCCRDERMMSVMGVDERVRLGPRTSIVGSRFVGIPGRFDVEHLFARRTTTTSGSTDDAEAMGNDLSRCLCTVGPAAALQHRTPSNSLAGCCPRTFRRQRARRSGSVRPTCSHSGNESRWGRAYPRHHGSGGSTR